MKIRLAVALVGLIIGFVLPTFAQQKNAIDPKIEQQIRVLAAKYDAAFNKHDSAAVAAFFTEDAVLGTPYGTFHGRQAIDECFRFHQFETETAEPPRPPAPSRGPHRGIQ
jgi:SnoaL-like domain